MFARQEEPQHFQAVRQVAGRFRRARAQRERRQSVACRHHAPSPCVPGLGLVAEMREIFRRRAVEYRHQHRRRTIGQQGLRLDDRGFRRCGACGHHHVIADQPTRDAVLRRNRVVRGQAELGRRQRLIPRQLRQHQLGAADIAMPGREHQRDVGLIVGLTAPCDLQRSASQAFHATALHRRHFLQRRHVVAMRKPGCARPRQPRGIAIQSRRKR